MIKSDVVKGKVEMDKMGINEEEMVCFVGFEFVVYDLEGCCFI